MDVLLNGHSVAFSKPLQAVLVQEVVFMGEESCRSALWQQQRRPVQWTSCLHCICTIVRGCLLSIRGQQLDAAGRSFCAL
jgi:hypothetical protein